MFLKNAWYVAALDAQVNRRPHATMVLGERIVLYRTAGGEPVALEDACPHRKLPLSMGRLQGDALECGYHGLTFDATGHCIRIPGAGRIPSAARVRRYPSLSRWGLVWVWMGREEAADPDRILAIEHADDPAWSRNQGGRMLIDCNYLYVTDNLLDPSHVAWVHQGSFGNEQCEGVPVQVSTSAEGVAASRWMLDVDVAPFYAPFVSFAGRADRLQHYEVRFPCHALVRSVFVPAGSGGPGRTLAAQAMIMDSYNFLTPLDEQRTCYYWFQTRNFAPGDAAVTRQMDEGVHAVFEEDRHILAAVQTGFASSSTPHIDLAIDRAPLLFRRRLGQLIAAEQSAAAEADRPAALPELR